MLGSRDSKSRLIDWLNAGAGACASVGEATRGQLGKVLQLAAIAAAALIAASRPAFWRRTVRDAFAREVLTSGVEALGIIIFLAVALGVLLVLQYQVWLGNIIHTRLLGSLFVAIVVRELAPLLVMLVLIARSGGVMAAQLALIHVHGEDRVAEGQGIDAVTYFVIPRALALTVSALCLTLVFAAASFLSVHYFGHWIGARTGDLADFAQMTLGSVSVADAASLLAKSAVPALLTGCICCAEGLCAGDTTAEVPRAARIAVQRSVVALIVVSVLVSIATYS